MPERNVGYVMTAHTIGGTFPDEVVARVGDFLDLVNDIFFRTNVLEIRAVLHGRSGNAVDGPHQI